MKAIILSAGQGSRLLPYTSDLPKCLLSVGGGMSLLEWQLNELQKAKIEDVVIVTGFESQKVETVVDAMPMAARTLYNPFYKVADNLGSVWLARHEMNDEFILINGDTLFTATVPQNLMAQAGDGITVTIARKDTYDDDDMKVVESGGRLLEIGKRLQRADVNAEAIGMIAFRGSAVGSFRAEIEASMRSQQALKNYYLSIIEAMANKQEIHIFEAAQDQWCEVDFPKDLDHARKIVDFWLSANSRI